MPAASGLIRRLPEYNPAADGFIKQLPDCNLVEAVVIRTRFVKSLVLGQL